MEEIILALELAQNQIAASRDMCSEDEGELWDVYQAAINKARSIDEEKKSKEHAKDADTVEAQSTELLGTVVAVDFDGTCVTHEFPKMGREIGAAQVLRRMTDAGAKIILWTMRSDGRTSEVARNGKPMDNPNPLTDAVKWFEMHGIPLYRIQRNPTQDEWTTSPKAYAKIYIDDAALGCPLKCGLPGERPHVDWDAVEAILFPWTCENKIK